MSPLQLNIAVKIRPAAEKTLCVILKNCCQFHNINPVSDEIIIYRLEFQLARVVMRVPGSIL